jgi:hypothetical protein
MPVRFVDKTSFSGHWSAEHCPAGSQTTVDRAERCSALRDLATNRTGAQKKIRATDAKEVGVENPAEETFRYPNQISSKNCSTSVRTTCPAFQHPLRPNCALDLGAMQAFLPPGAIFFPGLITRAHLDTAPKRWKFSRCENSGRESAVGGDGPKRPAGALDRAAGFRSAKTTTFPSL